MAKAIDISGQKFGKVLALYYDGSRGGYRYYFCQCDCGNKKSIKRRLLVKGEAKSCGCDWRLSNKRHNGWRGHGDIPMDFFSNIRRSAESRNIEFNITIQYLWDLYLKQDGKCALSGIQLKFSKIRKDNKSKNVSIDRIDSRIGYIDGNVQWIDKRINIMKNKFDENEFIEICNSITQNQKSKIKKMNNWKKIVHIESSMERNKNQYSLFIGRFQPLHLAHKEMFNQVLNEGGNVCIAIRDIEPNFKNPFTPLEVMNNIMGEYADLIEQNRVKVMIVPDICSVEFGRGVGYDIIEHIPPTEVADISATKIREQMRAEGKL